MAKYRVCEMVDGNGNVWWQVARVVCWFFFEWDRDWTFGVSRTLPKTVNKFDSKDEALHQWNARLAAIRDEYHTNGPFN